MSGLRGRRDGVGYVCGPFGPFLGRTPQLRLGGLSAFKGEIRVVSVVCGMV